MNAADIVRHIEQERSKGNHAAAKVQVISKISSYQCDYNLRYVGASRSESVSIRQHIVGEPLSV